MIKCPKKLPFQLGPGQSVIIDWEKKRTGWVSLTGQGHLRFAYAGDKRILDLIISEKDRDSKFSQSAAPNYIGAKAEGHLVLSKTETFLHEEIAAFRFFGLCNDSETTAVIENITMEASEFPEKPVGHFECSDPLINKAWQMGIDSVHLCTQPGDHSLNPVFGPFGQNYVQWDGCRRDREIWGGDLRTASLAWYYNFADNSPVANSLYLILSAQHDGCSEHGLFPASASTHQTFYEWALWAVVGLWEYYLHTGDQKLLFVSSLVLPKFLTWCEKKFAEHEDGWMHGNMSWMYTLPFEKQAMPGLQAVAVLALDAMVELFSAISKSKNNRQVMIQNENGIMEESSNPFIIFQQQCLKLRKNIMDRFDNAFFDKRLKAYRFINNDPWGKPRSDLCTNCWAILADIVPVNKRIQLLENLNHLHGKEWGRMNLAPVIEEIDSSHNEMIWPYSIAFEISARFYTGDADGALKLLRDQTALLDEQGYSTLPEAVYPDGSPPIKGAPHGTLSLCHAWASQSSWALQRYLLGVFPLTPGWETFSCKPLPSRIEWTRGKISTPHGIIEVELESRNGKTQGILRHPLAIQPILPANGESNNCIKCASY